MVWFVEFISLRQTHKGERGKIEGEKRQNVVRRVHISISILGNNKTKANCGVYTKHYSFLGQKLAQIVGGVGVAWSKFTIGTVRYPVVPKKMGVYIYTYK